MEKPAEGEMIILHYYERPPYYMTGPLGTLLNSDLVLLRKNGYSYGPFINTKITLAPDRK